jgi:hypothetical protein
LTGLYLIQGEGHHPQGGTPCHLQCPRTLAYIHYKPTVRVCQQVFELFSIFFSQDEANRCFERDIVPEKGASSRIEPATTDVRHERWLTGGHVLCRRQLQWEITEGG